MARMVLMAPKRAQEERNAPRTLLTWYAPFQGVAVNRVHDCPLAPAGTLLAKELFSACTFRYPVLRFLRATQSRGFSLNP